MNVKALLLCVLFCSGELFAGEPIQPVPSPRVLSPAKVELGKALFHDPDLSVDGTVSCASCHSLELGGVDQLPRSFGVNGQEGGINSPTVFFSALNFKQFWNGRALTLEEQVNGPITNPIEMGNSWPQVLKTLKADESYRKQFSTIYADGVSADNVRDAIAEFERSLTLDNSRFDKFLKGDSKAISDVEARGYALFKSYGCVACHQGAGVGGNMFQVFGVMGDYFRDRGKPLTEADLGRFSVTGKEYDKGVFKVPSLRMVVHTPPYFHDGSIKTLPEAIQIMAKYQLGRDLPEPDVKAIEAFLHTLSGTYDVQ